MQKILIIQTAFIGDVVLSTAIIEKIHTHFPSAQIDFLVRKGNESLLNNNPYLNNVFIWNKKENKYKNLFILLKKIRKNKYTKVITLQRYFATGFLTGFSNAQEKIGFAKNPLSFLFNKKINHTKKNRHEVERNNDLIEHFTDNLFSKPKLYPSALDFAAISNCTSLPFITMTPSSVWFTKQYPLEKWIEFTNTINPELKIFILGGKENIAECEKIVSNSKNKNIEILAGKLTFLQSAALMKSAVMNYANDSAPLHFASAVNANITGIFCSTIPAFGYTPLSDKSIIVETKENLNCRPCGMHGKKSCPEGHFKCGFSIQNEQLLSTLIN